MSPSETERAARFDLDALCRAIETRDPQAHAALYADDAEIVVVDAHNPPNRPRHVRGRPAIVALLEDVAEREVTHEIRRAVASELVAAYQVACRYDDGTRVLAHALLDLRGDRIAREEVVQVWDDG